MRFKKAMDLRRGARVEEKAKAIRFNNYFKRRRDITGLHAQMQPSYNIKRYPST